MPVEEVPVEEVPVEEVPVEEVPVEEVPVEEVLVEEVPVEEVPVTETPVVVEETQIEGMRETRVRIDYATELFEKIQETSDLSEEDQGVIMREAMRAIAWGYTEPFNTEIPYATLYNKKVHGSQSETDPSKITVTCDGKEYLFSQEELSGEWKKEYDLN